MVDFFQLSLKHAFLPPADPRMFSIFLVFSVYDIIFTVSAPTTDFIKFMLHDICKQFGQDTRRRAFGQLQNPSP